MKNLSVFVLFLFCLTFTLNAQVTTSGISGKVTAEGELLIGATVQAVHEPSGTTYGTVTNADGRYSLQGMRTGGPYTVEVSYVGFQKAVYKNITLQLGETYLLDVKLTESLSLDEVVVTASKAALFNSQKTGAAQNFNQSQIQATPSVSRSIFDVTKMNPLGVNTASDMSFAGSSNKYNSFQIDGITNNDVFGLSSSGTNGGQAGANPISLEAIEEIQVVIAPYDVRQGGFTGGGINAITKSGTNTFHGSAYWYYNNENFYGKTPGKDAKERKKLGDQSSATYGFTLGGPIVKDKLFFFANYERVKETYPSSNNIGSTESNLDVKEVDQIVNKISQLTGGYNAGGYGPQDIDTYSNKILTRLDWNINEQNKFTVRYSFLDGRKMVFSNSVSSAKLNDNGYFMNNKTHSLVSELNTQFTPSWSNEFRFGWTYVRDYRDPIGQPLPNITINNLINNGDPTKKSSLELGTERNSAANALDQDIFTLEDNLIWNKGNHTITLGTHNEFFHMKNLYITNIYGSYVYNSLDDFLTVGTANEVLPNSYEYSYSNEKITGTDRWAPVFGAAQLGFYAQDEWKVTNRFSMTYGLRLDIPLLFDKPRANEVFNSSTVATSMGLATDQMPTTKVLWSPRVGFRWSLNEDRTTLLRGGAGIFTGRVPFVWISNSFGNAGVEMVRTAYSSSLGNYPSDFKFNIDPNKQYKDPNAKVPTSEVDVMAKNFRFPSVFRANLAVEQMLPFGIRGTLEGLYSKTLNNILYENINYQWKGETLNNGGDDRPVYEKQDNHFTQVMLLKNTSKGYTFNITTKLEKSFDFGLNAMIAYTYGQAKSLNDGNSSQAYSGWKYNATYYGDMNPELTWSMFDVRNRVIGSVSYRKEYAKHFATTVSLFYNGQTGGRYSLLDYTDLNKDGYRNDLMYVPTDAELEKMVFTDIHSNNNTVTAAEQKDALIKWIEGNGELRKSKGTHIKRNQMTLPFEHHFDFHFAQDFFVDIAGQRNTIQLNFDIINVGNLLNKKWGMYYQTNSGYDLTPLTTKIGTNGATYQFYDPGEMYTNTNITSRWHAQVGLKYIF
ncbi:TonB-dependent receptor [uncultured Parabacteroides sp.]|uniref:TonB-dependent receptor n=1 Tax=uncultured Parabacteroides sp. TaxID=512312 RepID=UPI0025918926|nr:TonB-dependent receptor [uncultured Parabacteroides sp.]